MKLYYKVFLKYFNCRSILINLKQKKDVILVSLTFL